MANLGVKKDGVREDGCPSVSTKTYLEKNITRRGADLDRE